MLGFCVDCTAQPLASYFNPFIYGEGLIRCENVQICPICYKKYIITNSYECDKRCHNQSKCLALPLAISNKQLTGV